MAVPDKTISRAPRGLAPVGTLAFEITGFVARWSHTTGMLPPRFAPVFPMPSRASVRQTHRPFRGLLRWALLFVFATGQMACDDDPPATSPAPAAAPAAAPAPPPAVAEQPNEDREPELTAGDFISGVNNRDPFRSFLGEFRPKVARRGPVQRKVLLSRYGLDELRLIAVVSGHSVRARAMFRDPRGLGVAVKRGDRISKSEARVKRILRDSVVMEVLERSEDRQQAAERIIELHPRQERAKEFREFEGRELDPEALSAKVAEPKIELEAATSAGP